MTRERFLWLETYTPMYKHTHLLLLQKLLNRNQKTTVYNCLPFKNLSGTFDFAVKQINAILNNRNKITAVNLLVNTWQRNHSADKYTKAPVPVLYICWFSKYTILQILSDLQVTLRTSELVEKIMITYTTKQNVRISFFPQNWIRFYSRVYSPFRELRGLEPCFALDYTQVQAFINI